MLKNDSAESTRTLSIQQKTRNRGLSSKKILINTNVKLKYITNRECRLADRVLLQGDAAKQAVTRQMDDMRLVIDSHMTNESVTLHGMYVSQSLNIPGIGGFSRVSSLWR